MNKKSDTLHVDCPTGIGGDMFLAALADLGLDLKEFESIVKAVGIEAGIEAGKIRRNHLSGSILRLSLPGDQPLRHLSDLLGLLDRAALSESVNARAAKAFRRLADVEATAHAIPVEKVHFHEIGALDTFIDVVGAFWGLEKMGIRKVSASPLPWFRGSVHTDHGFLPLPAPATLELLKGKPVYPTNFETEIITPTGALIIDAIVGEFTDGPQGVLVSTGIGYGSKVFENTPNALRLYLVDSDGNNETDEVYVLESNVDHLTGEEIGGFFSAMFRAGALDVLYIPALMKKNRPGGILQVICRIGDMEMIRAAFFKRTLTLGIRITKVGRSLLPRFSETVESPYGRMRVKQAVRDGRTHVRPEYDSLSEVSEQAELSPVEMRHELTHKGMIKDNSRLSHE